MRTAIAAALLAAALLGGCTAATRYVPVGAARTDEEVFPATPYALRGDPNTGTIHVVSMDGVRLPVGRGRPLLYLHVRLVGENRADPGTWRLNPNQQMLSYAGGLVSPAFSKSSGDHPVLTLAMGTRGTLDLYYPLPDHHDPHEVTLWWRVQRESDTFTHTTSFLRTSGRDLPPAPGYYEPGYLADAAPFPSGLALGWWWPDYYFHGGWSSGGGWYGRSSGGRYAYGHPPQRQDSGSLSHESSGSYSWPSQPSQPSQPPPSSDTAANWRNPTAPSSSGTEGGASGEGGGYNAGDAAKSGWRGGGRH
jgi:hypothetical protein